MPLLTTGAGGYPIISGGGGSPTVFFDAISTNAPNGPANSQVWEHTPVGAPSAIILLVAGYVSATPWIDTCTYGGVAMTAGGTFYGGAGTGPNLTIFGLANPPSGPQSFIVTTAAGGGFYGVAGISVTGSSLTTCFRNLASNSGTGASTSTTVSSASTDLVIDCVVGFQAGAIPSGAGAGQTIKHTDFWNSNLSFGVSISNGASSVTNTWSTVNTGGAQAWIAANASVHS